MKLFTTIVDVSNHTRVFGKLADHLLSHIAPQQSADALEERCDPWEYYGCCEPAMTRYRRTCFRGSSASTDYTCEGWCIE